MLELASDPQAVAAAGEVVVEHGDVLAALAVADCLLGTTRLANDHHVRLVVDQLAHSHAHGG